MYKWTLENVVFFLAHISITLFLCEFWYKYNWNQSREFYFVKSDVYVSGPFRQRLVLRLHVQITSAFSFLAVTTMVVATRKKSDVDCRFKAILVLEFPLKRSLSHWLDYFAPMCTKDADCDQECNFSGPHVRGVFDVFYCKEPDAWVLLWRSQYWDFTSAKWEEVISKLHHSTTLVDGVSRNELQPQLKPRRLRLGRFQNP